MNTEGRPLGEIEHQVLHLLEKWDGQRFSLEQLTEGSDVTPEMAERTLLSLKKSGLIDMKETEVGGERGQPSLENTLFEVQELLDRLSKLAARRESTKATVFERVRERLNEELSKAIANLEFAADRTHDRLLHLTKEIEEFKERIDEATVSHDIGEISREEADKRIREFRSEITKLEAQRKGVLEARLEARETDASKKRSSENESRRLRDLLEELDIRKQVGEFEGRDGAFNAEKNRILADLASLSGEQVPGSVLVGQASNVVETAKALVDDKMLLEEIDSRLKRACERISEMSSPAISNHGK
jgi:DNA-binding IscR family transcriptional regulator